MSKEDDSIIRTAAHLAAIEISLGSFLHSLKIPFSGNFLSLNQGVFLCDQLKHLPTANRLKLAKNLTETSVVVACLKSLSPAGQKLGPMLSISMQGALFSTGVVFAGTGTLGQCFAMSLLSLWAFIQPAFTYVLVFGFELSRVTSLIGHKLTYNLVLTLILTKIILGIAMVLWGDRLLQLVPLQEFKKVSEVRSTSPFRSALKETFRPLFLVSYFVVLIALYLTESSWSKIFWLSLRPLGIAFLLFYLFRSPWFLNFILSFTERFAWTQKMRELAVKTLKKMNEDTLRSS